MKIPAPLETTEPFPWVSDQRRPYALFSFSDFYPNGSLPVDSFIHSFTETRNQPNPQAVLLLLYFSLVFPFHNVTGTRVQIHAPAPCPAEGTSDPLSFL